MSAADKVGTWSSATLDMPRCLYPRARRFLQNDLVLTAALSGYRVSSTSM